MNHHEDGDMLDSYKVTIVEKFLQDWRGRCLIKLLLESLKKLSKTCLAGNGDFYSRCAKNKTDTTKSNYDVLRAFITFQPFQKSLEGT